jgi:hypothetical protein
MVYDPEKADLEVNNQDQAQDFDGISGKNGFPITGKEEARDGDKDEDSIHSHSSGYIIEPVPVKEETSQRSKSKTSSTRSRSLAIVPRSKRRGLFGRFSIIPEVERPYDYPNKTKWFITFIIALAAAVSDVKLCETSRPRVSSTPELVLTEQILTTQSNRQHH